MEKFRIKKMSVKLYFSCVNDGYFNNNLRDYYEFLSCEICDSKIYGYYLKSFYRLRSFSELFALGFDAVKYSEMPTNICASRIY